jgi:hypothetical protein
MIRLLQIPSDSVMGDDTTHGRTGTLVKHMRGVRWPRAAHSRDQQLSLRYCAMGVIWLATICQRSCIFTQTLMKRYGPLLSLPL